MYLGVSFAEMHATPQGGKCQPVSAPAGKRIVYPQARVRITRSGQGEATSLTNAVPEIG